MTPREMSNGMAAAVVREKIEARVSIDDATGCWIWQRSTHPFGYGYLRLKKVTCYAHRLSYEAYAGPIGEFHVLHRCDTPQCCNPAHLFLGTNAQNVADMDSKGRRRYGGRPSGLRYKPIDPQAYEGRRKIKLSDRAVILDRLSRGETQASVARAFGVSGPLISRIASGARQGVAQ